MTYRVTRTATSTSRNDPFKQGPSRTNLVSLSLHECEQDAELRKAQDKTGVEMLQ